VCLLQNRAILHGSLIGLRMIWEGLAYSNLARREMNQAAFMAVMLFTALTAGRASTLTNGTGTADPDMIVQDSGSCTGQTVTPAMKNLHILPNPPETDCYVNVSLEDWANLGMMAPYPGGPVTNYGCASDLFLTCNIALSADQTTLDIVFSGTNVNFPGIPRGATFAIEIGSGWLANRTINVSANVPEPSTGPLIGCALLLAWAAVRFKRAARPECRAALLWQGSFISKPLKPY
jgi:hypothetical protein